MRCRVGDISFVAFVSLYNNTTRRAFMVIIINIDVCLYIYTASLEDTHEPLTPRIHVGLFDRMK